MIPNMRDISRSNHRQTQILQKIEYLWKDGSVEDYEVIGLIFKSAFSSMRTLKQMDQYLQDYIKPQLNDNLPITLIKKEGQYVGYMLFNRLDRETVYLSEMAISSEEQRKGYGSNLIFSIFERDPYVKKVHVIFRTTNSQAKDFYEKCGFVKGSFMPSGYSKYDFTPFTLVNDMDQKVRNEI